VGTYPFLVENHLSKEPIKFIHNHSQVGGCKTRHDHLNTVSRADRRANMVTNEYVGKFNKLNQVFNGEVIDDGDLGSQEIKSRLGNYGN